MNRTVLGRILVGAALAGMLATVVGTVVGARLLGRLDTTLDDSVAVTATTLDALATTVDLAGDALGQAATTLEDSARAAVTVRDATQATVAVLDGAADVTGDDVAGSLTAVGDALPALVETAAVVDATLSALDVLPLGPDYDPDVPLDDALRDVQRELDGLPAALEAEAVLLREAADRLGEVSSATGTVTVDLRLLGGTLAEARDLLADLEEATDEAAAIVGDGTEGLAGDLTTGRVLLVVAGLAAAVGQLVPLLGGIALLRPDLADRVLRDGAGQ